MENTQSILVKLQNFSEVPCKSNNKKGFCCI